MFENYLFVGLNNPQIKYKNTRHNVGAMFLNSLPKLTTWKQEKILVSEERGILIKDKTYSEDYVYSFFPGSGMNSSGKSIQDIKEQVNPDKMFVFHDDMDLELGRVKVKVGGGTAGHNGLKDIIKHGENDFVKIRIGIGRPAEGLSVTEHVLGDFSKQDFDKLAYVFRSMVSSIHHLLESEFDIFQNKLHLELKRYLFIK